MLLTAGHLENALKPSSGNETSLWLLGLAVLAAACTGCGQSRDADSAARIRESERAVALYEARREVADLVASLVRIPEGDPDKGDTRFELKVGEFRDGYAVLGFGDSWTGLFGLLEGPDGMETDRRYIEDTLRFSAELGEIWPDPAAFYVTEQTVYTVNTRAKSWAPACPAAAGGLDYKEVRDAVILRERAPGFVD